MPNLASQMRVAFPRIASKTGCNSPGELEMTSSTSLVAVCCSSEFTQLAEQPRVLDGDDRLGGEVLDQLDLLVGERPDFLAVDVDRAYQFLVLEHRNDEKGPNAAEFDAATAAGLVYASSSSNREYGRPVSFAPSGPSAAC